MPSEAERNLLVRLPGEPSSAIKHNAGALSMATWPGQENSATSSFSFVLGPAPHLDGQFTVFGELEDFANAKAVLDAIVMAGAKHEHVTIQSTRLIE
jgi:cyclophilin family peptidyl-prolyl cis-trans isomerase